MSIINEALKKTEEHLQKNAAKENSLPAKPSGSQPILFYVLILLAGLLLGNFMFNLLKHTAGTIKIPKNNPLPVVQITNPPALAVPLPPNPPIEENPHPAKANFVLNGIFFSDNDSYALINNQIVRENDYVDAAKVSSITANTVELDNAGTTITLTTPR